MTADTIALSIGYVFLNCWGVMVITALVGIDVGGITIATRSYVIVSAC